MIAVPAVYFTVGGERLIEVGVIVFFVIHLILAFIGAFADTGAERPNLWEKIARSASCKLVHISLSGCLNNGNIELSGVSGNHMISSTIWNK